MAKRFDELLMENRWAKGIGIFIEAFVLLIINCLYLIINYFIFKNDVINHIKNDILLLTSSYTISATGTIAILTSLLLAIGFIYHIGYFIAWRYKEPNAGFGGGSLRDIIIPFGAIYILIIFLPILIGFLLNSERYDIMLYIVINILFIFGCGLINEWIIQQYEENGYNRNQK